MKPNFRQHLNLTMVLFALILAILPSSVIATPFSLHFSGQITDVYDYSNVLGMTVNIGDTFNGELRFDPDNISYQDPLYEYLRFTNPQSNYNWFTSGNYLKVSLGSLFFQTDIDMPRLDIQINNGSNEFYPNWHDSMVIMTTNGQPYDEPVSNSYTIDWQFDSYRDNYTDSISSTSLNEIININLSNWAQNGLSIFGRVPDVNYPFMGSGYFLAGHVDSVTSIAEPNAYALVLFGFGLIVLFNCRKTKQI